MKAQTLCRGQKTSGHQPCERQTLENSNATTLISGIYSCGRSAPLWTVKTLNKTCPINPQKPTVVCFVLTY